MNDSEQRRSGPASGTASPSLHMVDWPTEKLVPYDRNPRKNDAVIDRMVASIHEFGFKVPVLARSDGLVVDGHLRLKAAQRLNLAKIPVILCDDWTEAQVKAFRLVANRSMAWGDWDGDLLALEMADLKESGFDLALTGFDEEEVAQLLAPSNSGLTDEDAVPDRPVVHVTQPGDLWVLGRHRLLCGDSTERADVERLLAGVTPSLMVTDPPYGVDYRPEWRNEALKDGGKRREGEVSNDDRADWSTAWALFPGSVAYVWHASLFGGIVGESLERTGFDLRSQIVWAKPHFAISRGHYHWQHECCLYAVRKGATADWKGDRSQTTLWQITTNQNDESRNDHGTQKPVECMRRPILNHTNPGQSVYDAFVGSGTTIIAAEMTGRVCYGADVDPAYVDVALRRWQDFTGDAARLDGSDRTFNEIGEGRRAH